jgi:hypothetical protein
MKTESMQDLPELHPDELAEIRRVIGRDLTNDEALALLHRRVENPIETPDLTPLLEKIRKLQRQ